ncbi:hypothetical protein A0H76_2150 [Hepatospora eriocheir]|uniref:Uncharacterized protein n=1 Tax=Hepatospora eriocheir TaxID=1081669 RepID=A0A1X0QFR4_9MICR|nr:hypothetical protein A0H76_2150 [Hepatospora eriocheir]
MTFKRKRRLKIENNISLPVLAFDEVLSDEIEDYEEIKASGVEEEEEKELHLQRVLESKSKLIPIPVVNTISNEACECFEDITLSKFINWQKDVSNDYIKTDEDIDALNTDLIDNIVPGEESYGSIIINNKSGIILLNEYNIEKLKIALLDYTEFNTKYLNFDRAIKVFGEDSRYLHSVKNHKFISFVLERTILRYDRPGFEAYICFRQRIQEPKIKSRKNENLTQDKLEYLTREYAEIDQFCELYRKRCELEELIFYNNINIIENYGSIFNSSLRKKLIITKSSSFNTIESIYRNRKKFKSIKLGKSLNSKNLILDEDICNKLIENLKLLTAPVNQIINQPTQTIINKAEPNKPPNQAINQISSRNNQTRVIEKKQSNLIFEDINYKYEYE